MSSQQGQYARENGYERVMPSFKRHILEASAGFENEPEADLYRINLLGMMLGRYDELREKGLSESAGVLSVIREFSDIPSCMREAGFQERDESEAGFRWPLMSEAEVDAYLRENDAYLHRIALCAGLCTASIVPMLLGIAVAEATVADLFAYIGMAGMFAVIGIGVYAIVSAAKPKAEKKIRKGEFSLSSKVRVKLDALKEAVEKKARKRMGRGVAVIIASVIPLLIAVAFSEIWLSDLWAMLGTAGMFSMIGAGVYQLVLSSGEKKSMKRLLKSDE